jgi:hypothetical protein
LLIFLQNLHGGMHPIEILEDLIGLIPVFQSLSQEKFLQKLNHMKFLCFYSIPKMGMRMESEREKRESPRLHGMNVQR